MPHDKNSGANILEKCAENAGHTKDTFAGEGAERDGKKGLELSSRGQGKGEGRRHSNSVSGQDQVQDGRIQSTGCKEGGQEMGLRD